MITRRFLATCLVAIGVFSVVPVSAQVPMTGAGKAGALGSAYAGPGDIVAFSEWFGLRCYSAAYSGNVVDVTDSATGNTTGTRLTCSGGVVSALVSANACTFVTGNVCSALATTCAIACNVVNIYDQTRTVIPLTQATNSARATYTRNCLNTTLPCLTFLGSSSQFYTSSVLYTGSQPFSFSAVVDRTATGSYTSPLIYATAIGFLWNTSANSLETHCTTDTLFETMSDNSWHALQGVCNGATTASVLMVDATAYTGLGGGTSGVTGAATAIGNIGGAVYTGKWAEAGMINGIALNSTQYGALHTNELAYYGTP